jgi:hypothetical protein
MSEKPIRRFQLCTERLETLEDVIKILNALQIRIDTNNPLYEELSDYFTTEVVPRGYIKVLESVGYEGIAKMTWEEIEQMGLKFLQETDIDI